ncbi:hypothetical protein GGR56DRAFT_673456 [Xylariaceae sp. FL0804]|nr:hypothetical protein GGR56DRAFT_673456 [Xylariaceae sp. FL0804]
MSSDRLSQFFDFRGASTTVYPGCSGTLDALHQAVKSPRDREADMSYAFNIRANAYGRGEGVATIVVKRLDDTLACGDSIRAPVRENRFKQDGKTETITTPPQASQEELHRLRLAISRDSE